MIKIDFKTIWFVAILITFFSCDKQAVEDLPKSNMRSIVGFTIKAGYNVDNIFVTHTGVINQSAKTITLELPLNVNLTTLRPDILTSPKTVVSPRSLEPIDLTRDSLEYTVTAESGKQTVYTVIRKLTYKYSGCTLYAVSFPDAPLSTGAVPRTLFDSNGNAKVTVPTGTDITKLIPHFELATDSKNVTFNKPIDIAYDFTSTVKFTVTSEDGKKSKIYAVTVTN